MTISDYRLFNGLNYHNLYETVKSKIKSDSDYYNDLLEDVNYDIITKRAYYQLAHRVKHFLLTPLHYHYETVKNISNEILNSELEEKQKNILYDIIINEVLQSYIPICSNESTSERPDKKGCKFLNRDIVVKNQWWKNNTPEIRKDSLIKLSRFDNLYIFLKENGILDIVKKYNNNKSN